MATSSRSKTQKEIEEWEKKLKNGLNNRFLKDGDHIEYCERLLFRARLEHAGCNVLQIEYEGDD